MNKIGLLIVSLTTVLSAAPAKVSSDLKNLDRNASVAVIVQFTSEATPEHHIARQQGRLKDALGYFETVLNLDEKHSQSEILRELGGVYIAAGQFEDARGFLADYVQQRPYDPEGLFYFGQALEGLGRIPEAREQYELATEAARTSPRYRRHITAKWSRLAQKQIRKLPSQTGA